MEIFQLYFIALPGYRPAEEGVWLRENSAPHLPQRLYIATFQVPSAESLVNFVRSGAKARCVPSERVFQIEEHVRMTSPYISQRYLRMTGYRQKDDKDPWYCSFLIENGQPAWPASARMFEPPRSRYTGTPQDLDSIMSTMELVQRSIRFPVALNQFPDVSKEILKAYLEKYIPELAADRTRILGAPRVEKVRHRRALHPILSRTPKPPRKRDT